MRYIKMLFSETHRVATVIIALALPMLYAPPIQAQSSVHLSWLERATITRSNQPHWVTPLITASANLEEAPIYDVSRRLMPTGQEPLVTAGGPRGVQFVAIGKLQVTFGATPYLFHDNSKVHDGFGDTSFAFKYRLASGNETHGGFALSAQLGATVPTGSYQNGQGSGTLTPNILAERGWGPFNIQSTFGASLSTGNTQLMGRQFISNTALEGRIAQRFWPEVEVNAICYRGGPHDGKKQVFVTPGLILGRFHVSRSAGVAFGVGMQIAVSEYHTYDHNLLFSVRLPLQSNPRD